MLPNGSCSGRIVSGFVIDLASARKRLGPVQVEPPRVVRLLAQAEEFRRLLDTGEARSRAELGRAFGLTRARVTQIMNLLKLHPVILDFIRTMPASAPRNWLTEKKLRRLATLSRSQQLDEARRMTGLSRLTSVRSA